MKKSIADIFKAFDTIEVLRPVINNLARKRKVRVSYHPPDFGCTVGDLHNVKDKATIEELRCVKILYIEEKR